MIKYIVLGCCRSGTTITHQILKGHPEINGVNNEVQIEPFYTKGISSFTLGCNTPIEDEKGRMAIFEAITSICANENTKAIGLKTSLATYEQAKNLVTSITNYFTGVKIIWTHRIDLVAQCGSLLRSLKTGQHHSWQKEKRKIDHFKINKQFFIYYLFENLRILEEIQKLKVTHEVLEFQYGEDIVNRRFEKLFSFLNVSIENVNWGTGKKLAPPANQYIRNYKELIRLDAIIRNSNTPITKKKYYGNYVIIKKYKIFKRKVKNILKVIRK